MSPAIPNRIIQTSKSADLPVLSKAAVSNIRLLNPEFEYMFFDDRQVEAFIDSQPAEYRQAYHRFEIPIQRYDFFRYLAVHQFGGFYFDMDVLLASNLSPLLQFDCVFPFESLSVNPFLVDAYGMDWEIGNYAFGASAGHPFLRAIIENCVRAQTDLAWRDALLNPIPRPFRDDFFVLCTTGPGLISRTLAEYPGAGTRVTVLFPDDVCDPGSWNRFGSYGVHLLEGSWRDRRRTWRRHAVAAWRTWRRNAVMKRAVRRGSRRSVSSAASHAHTPAGAAAIRLT